MTSRRTATMAVLAVALLAVTGLPGALVGVAAVVVELSGRGPRAARWWGWSAVALLAAAVVAQVIDGAVATAAHHLAAAGVAAVAVGVVAVLLDPTTRSDAVAGAATGRHRGETGADERMRR